MMITVSLVGFLGIALLLNSCGQSQSESMQTEAKVVKTQTVKLNVDGMTCGNCVNHVETALAKQPGVISRTVSLSNNSCDVEYDPSKTNSEEIMATIEKAGYSASVAN
jgi:copper chaperone CopZ